MTSSTVTTPQSAPPPLPYPFTLTTNPPPSLITQGAEAIVYRTHFLLPPFPHYNSNNNQSHIPAALKYRPPKPYRHPTLDRRLTRHRILAEARILVKCRKEGVVVPGLLALDVGGEGGGGGWMLVEWVQGGSVRDLLRRRKGLGDEKDGERVKGFMGRIGRVVGGLHAVGVVHGDLTTSNMMVRPGKQGKGEGVDELEGDLEGEIVLIDFGLAAQSVSDEDRAVDLYVLERAFGSTHPELEGVFGEVLRGYGESFKGSKVVLRRLEEVRLRGRKKSMIG